MSRPDRPNVAVTGFMATDNPQPGLAIARSLRQAPEFAGTITGLVFDPQSNGAFGPDAVDHLFLVPFPSAGQDVLVRRLAEIHARKPLDVIIPCLDSEVLLYAQLQPQLAAMGIGMLLPTVDSVKLRSKNLLPEFGLKTGIAVPETVTLNNADQIRPKAAEVGTPFLLKGLLSDAVVCTSIDQGLAEYQRLFDTWGYPILMQRFIFGEEVNVAAVTDRASHLVGAVVMKKFGITERGKACSGVTIENGQVLDLAARALDRLRWVGPAECEFVQESATGTYYLLEINGRFPAWAYLATAAGQNLALAAVDLALGKTVAPMRDYAVGKLFVRTITEGRFDHFKLMHFSTQGELHW